MMEVTVICGVCFQRHVWFRLVQKRTSYRLKIVMRDFYGRVSIESMLMLIAYDTVLYHF